MPLKSNMPLLIILSCQRLTDTEIKGAFVDYPVLSKVHRHRNQRCLCRLFCFVKGSYTRKSNVSLQIILICQKSADRQKVPLLIIRSCQNFADIEMEIAFVDYHELISQIMQNQSCLKVRRHRFRVPI